MFSYCSKNKLSICTSIGGFVNKELPWFDENKDLISTDIVNTWDRYEIAERYINECYKPIELGLSIFNDIGGIENLQKFKDEVALKIDEFIPKRYYKNYKRHNNTYCRDTDKKSFTNKDDYEFTRNLEYKILKNNPTYKPGTDYKKNYQASIKQIAYISALANKKGYFEIESLSVLDMNEASQILDFLLGKKDDSKIFEKYFKRVKDLI